jgi:hypothetical protein
LMHEPPSQGIDSILSFVSSVGVWHRIDLFSFQKFEVHVNVGLHVCHVHVTFDWNSWGCVFFQACEAVNILSIRIQQFQVWKKQVSQYFLERLCEEGQKKLQVNLSPRKLVGGCWCHKQFWLVQRSRISAYNSEVRHANNICASAVHAWLRP